MSTAPAIITRSGVWFVADLHFGHKNIGTWRGIEDHDEFLIDKWNSCGIRSRDQVWVLGDVAFNGKGLEKVARLLGKKSLVMGNHDNMASARYLNFFQKVWGAAEYNGMILTHVPVAWECIRPRYTCNVHGHTHDKRLLTHPIHYCVSLEQNGMEPTPYEEIQAALAAS